jgi:6-pyruvoyltetrahydropterin/6-carboxytetrahydropterin synthase
MYTLAVRRQFIARHALIGGDWGRENFPNSHRYLIELQLGGKELDGHGFLLDIVDVEKRLDDIVGHFREELLNDLPEFEGLNPSLEHFARIIALAVDERIDMRNLTALKVVLWEDDVAWVAYTVRP